MELWAIATALFSALTAALLGMVVGKLNGLETRLESQASMLLAHVTKSDIHDTGFAIQGEQIKALLETVRVAHVRVDKLEEKLS